MNRRAERPVETATIKDSTTDGRGIADTPGKKVFVDAALTGEVVRFQRQRKRRNFDQASLVEVVEASALRVTPGCEYFGVCGGCSLQHIGHAAQVDLKQQSLLERKPCHTSLPLTYYSHRRKISGGTTTTQAAVGPGRCRVKILL